MASPGVHACTVACRDRRGRNELDFSRKNGIRYIIKIITISGKKTIAFVTKVGMQSNSEQAQRYGRLDNPRDETSKANLGTTIITLLLLCDHHAWMHGVCASEVWNTTESVVSAAQGVH